MIDTDRLKITSLPKELKPYIGDYCKALAQRHKKGLLGESEYLCFVRFVDMCKSGKYRFASKAMDRILRFSNMLVYIDEDGVSRNLELYPAQKFILCGIFGLRKQDGTYLTNTANLYMGRRNGKSFLLSDVLHVLMTMSKFRQERIILASCKGQNATICFNEFINFTKTDKMLANTYSHLSETLFYATSKLTGNKLEMFKTGGSGKNTLDGFTNRVAVIDEEMLCDEIITKTIQDGQAQYKDRLLVTMSTAQFSINSDNHKKWLRLRKQLHERALPDNVFLFLAEPDREDVLAHNWADVKTWGKANPVLLFEKDGYTIKPHVLETYTQDAKEAVATKGFKLQSFSTKQCNIWYSAEDRSLCTFDQMKACGVDFSFIDCLNAGYSDWYIGLDLSMKLDLTSAAFMCYVGVTKTGKLVKAGKGADHYRLFTHVVSWMPKNKLQQHVESDQFPYRDYINKELYLCSGAGGENIDTKEILDYLMKLQTENDLHYVTIAADPYGVAGIQSGLEGICDTFILQNQTPKALSQYLETLSGLWKDGIMAYSAGNEDILEKAITNSVMMRNSTGYYSIEKISLKADSNIRIDPVDAMLTGMIAPYIDYNAKPIDGDTAVDEWLDMLGGE